MCVSGPASHVVDGGRPVENRVVAAIATRSGVAVASDGRGHVQGKGALLSGSGGCLAGHCCQPGFCSLARRSTQAACQRGSSLTQVMMTCFAYASCFVESNPRPSGKPYLKSRLPTTPRGPITTEENPALAQRARLTCCSLLGRAIAELGRPERLCEVVPKEPMHAG